MKDKNVIVTGGLGFIGSHIVDSLLEDNKVTIIDNMSTGKLENLENPNHENLSIIEEDLLEADLDEILKGMDYVFHLAALASVPKSVEEPMPYHETNINATVRLLIAAKNNGVKKVVFSSSSAVYGENPNMPLKEDEPLMPLSPYAAQKAGCELYLKAFAVIPNFISALLEGESPVIYGDGEQSRDFIYVKDIAEANIRAAESDYNGVVNVALGKSMTINHLFEVIKDVLDSDIEVKHVEERPGDIKHSLACIDNLKNIGFQPDTDTFEKHLRETVEWFKTQL